MMKCSAYMGRLHIHTYISSHRWTHHLTYKNKQEGVILIYVKAKVEETNHVRAPHVTQPDFILLLLIVIALMACAARRYLVQLFRFRQCERRC